MDKLAELPIYEWTYLVSEQAKHIGPTAEDFYATFSFGEGNKRIAAADLASTALAAIQALHQENQKMQEAITSLQSEIRLLKSSHISRKNIRQTRKKRKL